VWSARALTLVRREPEAARVELQRIREMEDSTFGSRAQVTIRHVEGRLELHDRELHSAEDTLHDALAIAWSSRLRPQVLHVLESLAETVAAQERHAEAAHILAACTTHRARRQIFEGVVLARATEDLRLTVRDALGEDGFDNAWTIGAAMELDEIIAAVRRGRGERGRPSFGWDSLTPTEERVIALVAEGLTNPQVGERINISRRTVQTHLAHVFAKLGVFSRTELTAAVVRRQQQHDDHAI